MVRRHLGFDFFPCRGQNVIAGSQEDISAFINGLILLHFSGLIACISLFPLKAQEKKKGCSFLLNLDIILMTLIHL